MMRYFMGIDIGTSGVKAVLIEVANKSNSSSSLQDSQARLVAAVGSEYPLYHPRPGWAEQEAEDWWRATVAAIRELLAQAATKMRTEVKDIAGEVGGLALSGQMHGAVLVDSRGRLLRRPILWCDVRTHAQCEEMVARVGLGELLRRTGNPALEGFTAPKLLWLREHEPAVLEQAHLLLLPKDYIRYRLTGEASMEISDAAGTSLFNVAEGRWDTDLAEKLEIPARLLPPVVESPALAGKLRRELAEETGLPAGLPIMGGGADNACGAVGAGVVRPGDGLVSVGTSGVVLVQTPGFHFDPQARIHSFNHAVPGAWYLMGVMLAAGLSYAWLRDNVATLEKAMAASSGLGSTTGPTVSIYELLDRQAAAAPAGSDGLIFLPYLNGERTPHADPLARGGWIGLTAAHGRAHLIRAVMEGVAFGLRDSLELIRNLVSSKLAGNPERSTVGPGAEHPTSNHADGKPVPRLRALGGGAKSSVWRQILADVLDVELEPLVVDEGPAFGAALLAAVGGGAFNSVTEAVDACVQATEPILPRPQNQEVYERAYLAYQSLYPALKETFHQMAAIPVR